MGLLIILAETCTSFGQDLAVLRTNMELGMIIAGIMVIIVALTGFLLDTNPSSPNSLSSFWLQLQ